MTKSNLTAVTVALGLAAAMSAAAAHESEQFSVGEPGDPKQPARIVRVIMREDGKKMLFEPARITVHKGEQIRFVLTNDGKGHMNSCSRRSQKIENTRNS